MPIQGPVCSPIDTQPFGPAEVQDAREIVARQIKARRGQKEFRDKLLGAYGGR